MRRGERMDVVVIGAGPGGLAAAIAAASRGKRVLVVDQGMHPGGQIWRHRERASLPGQAVEMIERAERAGVRLLQGARFIDARTPHELLLELRDGISVQETTAVILATGARERFVPFPGWTLPGVVGVGGMQALLKSGVSVQGARIVIAGSGPLLFPVAAALRKAGAELLLVGEQAAWADLRRFGVSLFSHPAKLLQAARYRWGFRDTPFRTGTWVVGAEGTDRVLRAIMRDPSGTVSYECDWIATAAGLVPNTDAAQVMGCDVVEGAIRVDQLQRTSVPEIFAAGECTGVKGDDGAIAEGEIAGCIAAGDTAAASSARLQRASALARRFAQQLATTFAVRPELHSLAEESTIVCRCEDVTRGAIDPAWTQRQAKLWTRVGMGACQGAVCGPACTAMFGWEANTARPPIGNPPLAAWAAALTPP